MYNKTSAEVLKDRKAAQAAGQANLDALEAADRNRV
jgi:hypothetical protein